MLDLTSCNKMCNVRLTVHVFTRVLLVSLFAECAADTDINDFHLHVTVDRFDSAFGPPREGHACGEERNLDCPARNKNE